MPGRVLFVAYLFPPVGGVGVHRVTKFVKYLPQFGWESSVLTVSNPSVPLFDESLLRDIPSSTVIRKAKTFEPGYAVKSSVSASSSAGSQGLVARAKTGLKSLARRVGNAVLQPDPQILWRWNAISEGMKLLRETPHDAIIATGPPFSSFLVGQTLARKSGLPLVLDYRDEWDISNAYWENKKQGGIANWVQQKMQHSVLRSAAHVVATTPASTAAVEAIARTAGSTVRGTCIYNGFDPDDFPANSGPATKKDYGNGTHRFRLSFIGTLWNLNSIEPVITAIQVLAAKQPALVENLELVLAGRRTADQDAIVDRLNGLPCATVRLPFVSHSEAVEMMRSADSLLMLNSDVPHAHRIINAKTFEYMAARRPAFVVAPRGDVWDILRDLPGTVLTEPSRVSEIADKLALSIEQHRCGVDYDDAIWPIERFERRSLAGELAEVLDGLVPTPTDVRSHQREFASN
jgi:hypothetical protein